MEYQAQEKSRRFKFILFGVLAAVVVVLVGAWIITSAIHSVKNDEPQTTQVTNTETASNNGNQSSNNGSSNSSNSSSNNGGQAPATTTEPTSPANQYNNNDNKPSTNSSNNTPSSSTPTATVPVTLSPSNPSSNLPTTGPTEDLIFSAILMGISAYLIFYNIQLSKKQH